MEIERKSFTGVQIKKDKPGAFTARIATLNVIDKDGDVTLPGAFPDKKSVLISAYMHGSWMGSLPVGKGVIREEGEEVFVDGEFNLDSETGREHYATVKFSPELTEWSYGFKVLAVEEDSEWAKNPKVWRVFKSLDVFEASPVLLGAGVNTGTLAIKEAKTGLTFADQAEAALAAVKNLAARARSLADLRRSEGRDLSSASQGKLQEIHQEISAASSDIKALVEKKAAGSQPEKALIEALKIQTLTEVSRT